MRAIVSVSMPLVEKKKLESRAKKAKKSVSRYIIESLKMIDNMISEDELLVMAERAEASYKAGKTKRLTSLADLLKEE